MVIGSLFGPIGTFVGGIIGGGLGGWLGRKVGREVHQEVITVRFKSGNNANEVICSTTKNMKVRVQDAIDKTTDYLTTYYMDSLLGEIGKIRELVTRWERKVKTIS
jgi:phage tail tape-measure protein